MCGIAGYWSRGPHDSYHQLERMCDAIVHRGPDAFGSFCEQGVALGHRRLSIIDVSGGDQPIGNEDGSVQIVFNGEIYNYLALRQELIAKGHTFTTHSDTEVLVHLYEEEGELMPERLNGMFTFAIWDKRRQRLFLARDRFGKKPLYFSTSVPGMRFCFASELKALATLDGFRREPDAQAVSDFLCLGYVPDPQCIFRGVEKLPPAHSITVSATRVSQRRYWAPPFERRGAASFDAHVEQIREVAADAVKCRLMSDVPLGAFLSGGMDSSAVVAFMARAATSVRTFSIGFDDEAFNELPYARQVARQYNTLHHEEVVTPSVYDAMETLVRHFDEPFGDPSAIPTLYLSRMTRKHVTVALSGDGGDEVFGGYRRYYWNQCEERLRRLFPQWFRQTVIRFGADHYPAFEYMPRPFRAKATLCFLANELADGYFTHMSVFRDANVEDVLSPQLRGALHGYSSRAVFRERFHRYRDLSPLQQMQAVDMETYLPGDILVKIDRAAMAYSLEARCPWLDYRLAEIAVRAPSDFLLRGDIGKHVFRQVVEPLLPPNFLDRPKMGFAVPLASWFRTSLKPVFESLVFSETGERYVSLPAVRHLWQQHQTGFRDHSRKLWNLLMLAAWDRQHIENKPANLALAAAVGERV